MVIVPLLSEVHPGGNVTLELKSEYMWATMMSSTATVVGATSVTVEVEVAMAFKAPCETNDAPPTVPTVQPVVLVDAPGCVGVNSPALDPD